MTEEKKDNNTSKTKEVGKKPRRFVRRRPRVEVREWIPKTELGRKVMKGEITDMEQIYSKNLAVLEPEIIDKLVPGLEDQVLKIKMVQRTTDSGRKGSFMITVAIGNKDGYVGVGTAKGLEIRPVIEKAIREAKRNIIHIRRGCGSWECACNEEHSIAFNINGKYSSVEIELFPAPKGTGIVAGSTAAKVLKLAGVKDVWSRTRGSTNTVFNFAFATIKALKQTRKMKLEREVDKK